MFDEEQDSRRRGDKAGCDTTVATGSELSNIEGFSLNKQPYSAASHAAEGKHGQPPQTGQLQGLNCTFVGCTPCKTARGLW